MVAAAYSQLRFNAQWKHDIWIEEREWEEREQEGKSKKKTNVIKKKKKKRKEAGTSDGGVAYPGIQICRLGGREGAGVS